MSGLGELAGAVATMEAMHQIIVSRLNDRLARLAELLRLDPSGVEECRHSGYAYSLREKTLAYDTCRLVVQFFSHMFGRQLAPETTMNALTERGADVRWIKMLKDERNIFMASSSSCSNWCLV